MTTASPTPGEAARLDALIALAQRAHRAGRLDEAVAAYREILALRPDIAEAHNNLGVALGSQGKLEEAQKLFKEAIALRPGYADAHNNLGNVFRQQGQLDQAAAQYRHAVALRPAYVEALNSLGNVLKMQGNFDEAAARFQQLLAFRPGDTETLYNLGVVLTSQGKLEQAMAQYWQAVALRPDFAEAHNNLGVILAQQGKLDQAVARFEQAVTVRPEYAEALNNLGVTLGQQKKLDQALARFEQAIAHLPDYAEAHLNLGITLREQGKLDQAVARFEQAIALRPHLVEAHNNLGAAVWQQGNLDAAAAHCERAVALRPDYAEAHNNLGSVLLSQFRLGEAAARFEHALALKPDYAEAEVGLATCYLVQGDCERGWPAYEARLRIANFAPRPAAPLWTGQPLAGRSLLLLAEQGLGDTIHFVRYARLLKERGARVVLAVQPVLRKLLASYRHVDELFFLGSGDLPHTDFYLPLLSAPAAFRTDLATIPGDVPYLAADPVLTGKWRQELAETAGFKIAIVWQGSRDYRSDCWRSIPLAQFAPLARVPGVRLISLQKGFGSDDVANVDFPVLDLSGRLDDAAGPFIDTAAVIRGVDLVVAANTAIAHLAGALGSPVWVAIPFSPDWRWLRDRDDTPWYPTMRLFRQTKFNEWGDVFERIAAALDARRAETA